MSFIPSQPLSKLLCANCKEHLSYFPIYFHPKNGSYCGRCSKPEEGVRNHVYEIIAQTQKFPCSYHINGCTENLVPSKMPHHEKYCSYRKCDCLTLKSTKCKWRGYTKDLADHIQEKHPTFFLTNAQFELDFINSYSENCLLPFGQDWFIISRSSDSKSRTFSCNVSYQGTNSQAEDYTYKIILENERKTHAHVITNKLNTKTDINVQSINEVLNNPSSIIATIEILEHAIETDNSIEIEEEEGENQDGLNYDLLKELECTVCFEYMLPPIYQCLTGHSICLGCKNSVDKCPSCREEFKNTQNFTLAQVINHIPYPCKNKRCKFTSKAKDIKKHEATCIFGPIKCPLEEYEDCHESIIFSEIYDHIVNHHYENLLEIETVTVPFETTDSEIDDCYIIRHGFRLFKLHYLLVSTKFFWAMQLIGPAEESENYMFEIDVVDNSGKNQRAYFKSFCSPLSDSNTAFDDNKSFIFIYYDQIKSMITDNFSYRVRILQE